jgi:hypothetical protein
LRGKAFVGVAKVGAILSILLVTVFAMMFYVIPVLAAHTSTADLQPEWSPAGQNISYAVTITNFGPDTVDEVRIYKNENYTDFFCDEKPGWYYNFIKPLQACHYVHDPDKIPANETEDFTFYAVVPTVGCNLTWKFETRDENFVWRTIYDNTSVDTYTPKLTKTVTGPQKGPCPPGQGEECWVTNQTLITALINDSSGTECDSGLKYCQYQIIIDGNKTGWVDLEVKEGSVTASFELSFKEDSVHELEIECEDVSGNYLYDIEKFRVDSTPPETEKTLGDPFVGKWVNGSWVEWINMKSLITLDAVDPDITGYQCNIGVNETWYLDIPLPENDWCLNPEEFCKPIPHEGGDGGWTLYTGPFTKGEESCHELDYHSIDELGNKEEVKANCFFVDDTPPVIEWKEHGYPSYKDFDPTTNTTFHWVTQDTNITIFCNDPEPHPVEMETLFYRFSKWSEGFGKGNVTYSQMYSADASQGPVIINFDDDCWRDLEYSCSDGLNNTGDEHLQYYIVETVPPVIEKDVIGPQSGDCPPELPGDICYVQMDQTIINVKVHDPEPHPSNSVECEWGYEWEGKYYFGGEEQGEVTVEWNITFEEDSSHNLLIECWDKLDNYVFDNETFLVDGKPPETTKDYGEPFVEEDGYHWINSSTPVTFFAEDEKIGVDEIVWRNTVITNISWDDCYAECDLDGEGNWTHEGNVDPHNANVTIFKPEESCHVIEFYSVDLLGYEEQKHKQCVFVDNTPPEGIKDVGKPNLPAKGDYDYYVSQETDIKLDCNDIGDHPVDDETVYWQIGWYVNGSWTYEEWEDSSELPVVINFEEDSNHSLEFFCTDALGNKNMNHLEKFHVETEPPTSQKSYLGPFYTDFVSDWIDTASTIEIIAYDPKPHPSGVSAVWYRYYQVDDSYCWDPVENCFPDYPDNGYKNFTEPFGIPNESCYIIEHFAEDNLNNKEDLKWQCVFVDKTPPVTNKTYIGPYFEEEGVEWINLDTEMELSAYDPEPHPSGVRDTWWRMTMMGSNDPCWDPEICEQQNGTGDFIFYSGPFSSQQESCHLIEYKSIDNVEKVEETKKQCVFVDNTAPMTLKDVGEPKDPWTPGMNGDDNSTFYPEANTECNQGMACWEVTTMTPIYLGCNDTGSHPVDHEEVCFMVDFDGDDLTEDYCDLYEGNMVEGYCCVDESPVLFTFGEESEHMLDFYCIDALGNNGKAYSHKEYFKVEGSAFEIEINKKWNLISVPFVLMNDTPEHLFKDIEDDIVSVWTYERDGNEWFVYTPDGVENDNLEHIIPGWGYWVFAKDDAMLLIGGDLFFHGKTPPSKDLTKGWNLIGEYGNYEDDPGSSGHIGDPILAYYGPDQNGRIIGCSLNSLTDTGQGYPLWSSLYTYWEPYNPDQWEFRDFYDYMDPGAGYWIEINEDDLYAWSTTCSPLIV